MDLPEYVAKKFHEAYEELAPDHGYETRKDSAVAWEDVPDRNKSLMIATVKKLMEDRVILAWSPFPSQGASYQGRVTINPAPDAPKIGRLSS